MASTFQWKDADYHIRLEQDPSICISCILSDHKGLKQELNTKVNSRKNKNKQTKPS